MFDDVFMKPMALIIVSAVIAYRGGEYAKEGKLGFCFVYVFALILFLMMLGDMLFDGGGLR